MKNGYTLVEILISFFIFMVISGGIFLSFISGTSTWYSSDAQIELQQELRKAIGYIADDLKLSGSSQLYVDSSLTQPFPANGVSYSSIAFLVNQGITGSGAINWSSSPVSYTLSGNQVIRTNGTNSTIVANKITGINFTRSATLPYIVNIVLSAQKTAQSGRTVNSSLNTGIAVRN